MVIDEMRDHEKQGIPLSKYLEYVLDRAVLYVPFS